MSKQEILKRLKAIDWTAPIEDIDGVRYRVRQLMQELEQQVWWEEVGPSGQHQESR